MLDPKLQDKLRKQFNPDGSPLRRHQLRMLEMLKYVDKVCRENQIPYWLSSGTCLGAVRHAGFIPWDDDVDIEMLREDYLKLEKILSDKSDYDLQTYQSDLYYVVPYAKLRDRHSVILEHSQDKKYRYTGIYIDIFQLEPLPVWLGYLTGGISWRLLLFGANSNKWLAPLFILLKKAFYLFISVLRFFCRHCCNSDILRHTFGSGFSDKTRKKSQLFPLSEAVFEDGVFPVPKNTDFYLRQLYGDTYMTLPETGHQQPHITHLELF